MLIDVTNQSAVGDFTRGSAKNRKTQALLMQLFALLVEYGLKLSHQSISTAENKVADAISRPSREDNNHIASTSLESVWEEVGPF